MSSPSRVGRPEAVDAAGREQLLRRRSASSSSLASSNSLRAASPTFGIVEDRGILALQLPGHEERRPVDVGHELVERKVARARACRGTPAWRSATFVQSVAKRLAQRLGVGHELALLALRAKLDELRSCSCAVLARRSSASLLGSIEPLDDADAARGVEHVDDRLVVGRRDLHGRVLGAGRRAADQQRQREALRAPSRWRRGPSRRGLGVIRPRQADHVDAFCSRAVSRIFSQGTITPRSMTS